MNKFLMGLLMLSITGNIFQYLKPSEVVLENILPDKVIVKETETITLKDATLESDLKLSKDKLLEAEDEIARLQAELDLIKDREELAKLNKAVDKDIKELADDEQSKISEETLAKIQKEKEAIRNLYQQESVDETWAYQTQDSLRNALNEFGNPSAYELNQIECKTSICKIKMTPYKQIQNGSVMVGINTTMALSASNHLREFSTNMELHEDNGVHSATVYVYKK